MVKSARDVLGSNLIQQPSGAVRCYLQASVYLRTIIHLPHYRQLTNTLALRSTHSICLPAVPHAHETGKPRVDMAARLVLEDVGLFVVCSSRGFPKRYR